MHILLAVANENRRFQTALTVPLIFWCIHPPHLSKNKTTRLGGYIFGGSGWIVNSHYAYACGPLSPAARTMGDLIAVAEYHKPHPQNKK